MERDRRESPRQLDLFSDLDLLYQLPQSCWQSELSLDFSKRAEPSAQAFSVSEDTLNDGAPAGATTDYFTPEVAEMIASDWFLTGLGSTVSIY